MTERALEKLGDSDLSLADPNLDLRGRAVVDRNGDALGHVSGLFIDPEQRKVRMLALRTGGFLGMGARHVLIPVDAIAKIETHVVHVDETRDRILGSPPYDPELVEKPTPSVLDPYYSYFGLQPFWGTGYSYPTFPPFPTEEYPAPAIDAR